VGTDAGLFLSTNNGTNWTSIGTGLIGTYVNALAFSGVNLFAATDGGIFLSNDNGISWNRMIKGITNPHVRALAYYKKKLIAGIDCGIYLSNDNGEIWIPIDKDLVEPYVVCFAMSNTTLYAVRMNTATMPTSAILNTEDGMNWTKVETGLIIQSLAVRDTIIFAGTINGVFRSTNSGNSWMAINNGLTDVVNTLAISGQYLYAGTYSGVFRSNNDGASWTPINDGLIEPYISTLISSGPNIYAGTFNSGIFISRVDDTSWTAINSGLTNLQIRSLIASDTNIFAGTEGGGVFLSKNNGASWNAINTGLTYFHVNSLALSDSYLFAGTYYGTDVGAPADVGVWRCLLTDINTSVSKTRDKNPQDFVIQQNYPNPFNSTTTIEFSLPKNLAVSLKIYDVLGHEITTLVSEKLNSGSYMKTWNASNIPSGVYFYRLQAGPYMETKKLILLK
jgi:ligand-binding sensor domain-containing protein